MSHLSFQEFVMLDGDAIATDSRLVAAHFGKRHADVLRVIDSKIGGKNPVIADFAKRNFTFCADSGKAQNGKALKFYKVSKDGFMRPSIGFTGERAERTTIGFIQAFDAMPAYIKRRERTMS